MICAALLAGGIGTRLDVGMPKQFYLIADKPILIHSLEAFLKVEEMDEIIVSSPKECINKTKDVIKEYELTDPRITVIEGGKRRSDTILNSINYTLENDYPKDSIMVTHDAARIFVTPQLIKDSVRYAKQYGAASAVIPATDVIFESKKQGILTDVPDRQYLLQSQTPQSFNINHYLEIYSDLSDEEIDKLDEAMILFHMGGHEIGLFEGDRTNFKVTRPSDIKIANAMLRG